MDRREFLVSSLGGTLGASCAAASPAALRPGSETRALFPRLQHEVYLNAAGATPQGTFAADGLRRFEQLWREGGSWAGMRETMTETRDAFARLIGARPSEIGFVHCTKAGEQLLYDGLPRLREGGNVVTNDLHFAGCLHNLVGLRGAGLDVRIVRSRDWATDLDAMAAAIDERTALVSVTLLSNVNGHIEPIRELAELAHARGALVYADVIQAAGIYPIDVAALDIDFAACSGYKWLYGTHGAGFVYVRQEHQGTALPDRLFPGHAGHNYVPWVEHPDEEAGDYKVRAPEDATRYQPGHIAYLGYCAQHAGLRFLEAFGVERALAHSVALNLRLRERLDSTRYECISPHVERSPIITFRARSVTVPAERLRAEKLVVSVSGARVRVSPAIYNIEDDVERLAEVLNRA